MEPARARTILGVRSDADSRHIRSAYLDLVRAVHPDVNPGPDASVRTSEASDAYHTLINAQALTSATIERVKTRAAAEQTSANGSNGNNGSSRTWGSQVGSRPVTRLRATKVGEDRISLGAPLDETYPILVELGHEIGDVTYVEPATGLVQSLVQFVEAPPCYLLLTGLETKDGTTQVSIAIESLNADPAPPLSSVTDLVSSKIGSLTW